MTTTAVTKKNKKPINLANKNYQIIEDVTDKKMDDAEDILDSYIKELKTDDLGFKRIVNKVFIVKYLKR